ncbi:MAG: hypothetical protein H7338_07415, partial [Candidatus Sericytochromatia bacterium]|nr:hypothetical protein [Candidatus Sericytochromatia bacterium]
AMKLSDVPSVKGPAAHTGAIALLAKMGHNWNNVRAEYAAGRLTHPGGGMQAMLNYRGAVVDTVLTKVRKETMSDAIQHRMWIVNPARKAAGLPLLTVDPRQCDGTPLLLAREAENRLLKSQGKKELPFPPAYPAGVIAPLVWGNAGSQDATSDIDVNLKGDNTEFASQRANELFRKEFGSGADAGMVFDVNFYAMDFMPSFKPGDMVRKEGVSDVETYAAAPQDWTMPLTDATCVREFDQDQQHNSQYMIRTYMSTSDWTAYKAAQIEAAPESGKVALGEAFTAVEASFTQHNAEVAAEIAVILQSETGGGGLPDVSGTTLGAIPDEKWASALALDVALAPTITDPTARKAMVEKLVMKAENNLYAKHLNGTAEGTPGQAVPRAESVIRLRDKAALCVAIHAAAATKIPAATTEQLAALDLDTQKAFLALRKQLSHALTFANEPYLTEASVLHVVINKQMLTKGIGDGAGLKDPKAKFPLSKQQWLHSVNEQFACCCKELGRHHDMGHALLHGGKYLHRMMNGAKHLEKVTGQRIASPPSQDFLRAMTKAIVAVKKNPRIPDAQKGPEVIRMLKAYCDRNPAQGLKSKDIDTHGPGGLQAVLTQFHAATTAAYRRGEAHEPSLPMPKVRVIVQPVVAYRLPDRPPVSPARPPSSPHVSGVRRHGIGVKGASSVVRTTPVVVLGGGISVATGGVELRVAKTPVLGQVIPKSGRSMPGGSVPLPTHQTIVHGSGVSLRQSKAPLGSTGKLGL